LPPVEDADFDITPAFERVDLSRVDWQLQVALGLSEGHRGGPLVAIRVGMGGDGMAELADGVVVPFPARHLGQGDFGADEGLRDAE
jgi:hypothetical protein